jgi:hypothetical protein
MTPRWERRFRAPEISFPDWSRTVPGRLVYASTESGIWQAHALDLATGARRQVTDHPVGVVTFYASEDGSSTIWWQDETGDESGRWLAQDFGGGEARALLDGVPAGWNEGFAEAAGVIAAGISDRAGFAVHVSAGLGVARELHRSREFGERRAARARTLGARRPPAPGRSSGRREDRQHRGRGARSRQEHRVRALVAG